MDRIVMSKWERSAVITSPPPERKPRKKAGSDLRKRAIKNAGGTSSSSRKSNGGGGNENAAPSRLSTPTPTSRSVSPAVSNSNDNGLLVETTDLAAISSDVNVELVEPVPLEEVKTPKIRAPRVTKGRDRLNFYGNSNYYCFFRLFVILHQRLSSLKSESFRNFTPATSSVRDGPDPDPNLQNMPDRGLENYIWALETCERFFEESLDQARFEDVLRPIFKTGGYAMYTIDKVLKQLTRQLQAITLDPYGLLALLQAEREDPDRLTTKRQVAYRSTVESRLADGENLYRLEWLPDSTTFTMQLCFSRGGHIHDSARYEKEWAVYMDSYIANPSTKGLCKEVKSPVLARNLRAGQDQFPNRSDDLVAVSGLEMRIAIGSYTVFYLPNTEDCLFRTRPSSNDVEQGTGKTRVKQFLTWVDERFKQLSSV